MKTRTITFVLVDLPTMVVGKTRRTAIHGGNKQCFSTVSISKSSMLKLVFLLLCETLSILQKLTDSNPIQSNIDNLKKKSVFR